MHFFFLTLTSSVNAAVILEVFEHFELSLMCPSLLLQSLVDFFSQYFLGCPFHFVFLPPFQLRPCHPCLGYCTGCINRDLYTSRPRYPDELLLDSSLVILLPEQKYPVALFCVLNKIWMPYLSFP